MPTVDLRTAAGGTSGSVELDDSMFGIQPHVPVLHQVVTAQLAAARQGTQSTKTRSEVSGGGAKPFRQKGTGRARQGSTRAPHWSGGGIALGPKPRSYSQRTPKKMIRLALASALSDRANEGRVVVVDEWGFDAPKTANGIAALRALGVEGRVLVVVSPEDDNAIKSFRNLPEVQLIFTGELNAYDVLCNEWVVFTSAVVPAARPASTRARRSDAPTRAKAEPVQPANAEPAQPTKAEPAQPTKAEPAQPGKAAPKKPAPFTAAGPTGGAAHGQSGGAAAGPTGGAAAAATTQAAPEQSPAPVHDAQPAEGDAAVVDEAVADAGPTGTDTTDTTAEAGE